MGGHDEKLKNFGKSEKNRISLRIRQFEAKNFKIEIANVIFRTIFNESENFFDRSRKSNAVFGN